MAEYLNAPREDGISKGYVSLLFGRPGRAFFGSGLPMDNNDLLQWPLTNVWLGTSCEDQKAADERIPHLLECPAAVRFLSCEPLVGPVNLSIIKTDENEYQPLSGGLFRKTDPVINYWLPSDLKIHWVITGGESGPNAVPMHPDWVRSLRDQCLAADVPFFFKQWGHWTPGSYLNKVIDQTRAAVLNNGEYGPHYPGSDFQKKYSPSEWGKLNPTAMSPVGKKEAGRMLDGKIHSEMPTKAN